MEESAKKKVRQSIDKALTKYFEVQDFFADEYSPKDNGRIEQVVSHIADVLDLPSSFKLGVDEHVTSKLSTHQRLWLRAYITHTLARLKHEGRVRRIMHGVYRP